MGTPRLRFTAHVVTRYIERWKPGIGRLQAKQELEAILERARPMKQRARGEIPGDLWASDGMRFVVRHGWQVVTVLPPERQIDAEDPQADEETGS